MKNLLRIICLFQLFFIQKVYAKDSIECPQNGPGIENSIFSLFSTVKNDVLGTVPKFCRKNEVATLSDQTDPGEKSLKDFVEKLKSLKNGDTDIIAIDQENDVKVQETLFNTFKIVILKKMWNQTNKNEQYNLLTSPECYSLGLNRFLLHQYDSGTKTDPKNIKAAYEKTTSMCKAQEFKQIAPYITKDVLAEVMINLKNLFPKSFETMVDSVCEELTGLDELIFKKDEYAEFGTAERSIKSVEDFSGWLKKMYEQMNSEEPKLTEKALANQNQTFFTQYSAADYFKAQQKELEKVYKSKLMPGEADHPVMYDNTGYLLYKNSIGKYFTKKSNEQVVKEEADNAKNKLANESYFKKMEKVNYDNEQKKLGTLYNKLSKDAIDGLVPYPDFPGYFVGKNNDGSFYYKVENLEELTAKIKKMDEMYELKNKKDLENPQAQAYLKQQYEQQIIYEDEDLPTSGAIIKDENGMFKYNINNKSNFMGGLFGVYSNSSSNKTDSSSTVSNKLFYNNQPIPVPNDMWKNLTYNGKGYSLNELKTGKINSNPFGFSENDNPLNENEATTSKLKAKVKAKLTMPKQILNPTLLTKITQSYQSRTTDIKKYEDLTKEETANLKEYTGSGYGSLNSCLRKEACDSDQQKKITNIVNALEKIKKDSLKDENGNEQFQVLFRGTKFIPAEIKEQLDKSAQGLVLDKGFMSSTGDVNVAKGFAGISMIGTKSSGILFIMNTKSCIGISIISNYKNEDEFLCPPGMKFNVTKKPDQENVYILDQVK
jgi:hypothetical protein